MRGYRKMIIAGGILLAAVFAPMDADRADVLSNLAYAVMGANALVSVGGALGGALGVRNNGGAGSAGSSPRIPDEE